MFSEITRSWSLTYMMSLSFLRWPENHYDCSPSGDVTISYSEDLMSRSPSLKVKSKVKGHSSRSYRQFQWHWPQCFLLDNVSWYNVCYVWRHRLGHPISIPRSNDKVKGHVPRSNLMSRPMVGIVLVLLWVVPDMQFCDGKGQWPWPRNFREHCLGHSLHDFISFLLHSRHLLV